MNDDKNPYRTMPAPAGQRDAEAARLVGQPMTVEFSLTGDDYAAFNLHWHRTSGAMRRRWRKVWVLLSAMTLGLAMISIAAWNNQPDLARLTALVAVVMSIYILFLAASRRRIMARSYRSTYRNMTGRALVGRRRLTISPQGIETNSDVSTGTFQWIGIERIETDNDHVFLYIGSAAAIIVPKRAFQSETHFQAFVETARQFQRQTMEMDALKSS